MYTHLTTMWWWWWLFAQLSGYESMIHIHVNEKNPFSVLFFFSLNHSNITRRSHHLSFFISFLCAFIQFALRFCAQLRLNLFFVNLSHWIKSYLLCTYLLSICNKCIQLLGHKNCTLFIFIFQKKQFFEFFNKKENKRRSFSYTILKLSKS